jgi:primosomal protein N' (replication factor Y)
MQNLCRQDYSELMQDILQERKLVGFPPFVRVVCFIVDAVALEMALERLQALKTLLETLAQAQPVKIVGPIPALMTRRVGRYRAQLSVLAEDFQALRRLLRRVMPEIEKQRNTQKSRLSIEVDPLDL